MGDAEQQIKAFACSFSGLISQLIAQLRRRKGWEREAESKHSSWKLKLYQGRGISAIAVIALVYSPLNQLFEYILLLRVPRDAENGHPHCVPYNDIWLSPLHSVTDIGSWSGNN